MEINLTYHGKPLRIELSPAAAQALEKRTQPLQVNARLYFGCMARKEVNFADKQSDQIQEDHIINSRLSFNYQSMMSDACAVDSTQAIYRPTPKQTGILRWLKLDYQSGEWQGKFGLS